MAHTSRRLPAHCDPVRVRFEISRLQNERRTHRRSPDTGRVDFAAEASAAHCTADWFERLREQHGYLAEWARSTGQPFEVRQSIRVAEQLALRKALSARARAGEFERRAAAAVIPGTTGVVRSAA
jgi:hypothetical protein